MLEFDNNFPIGDGDIVSRILVSAVNRQVLLLWVFQLAQDSCVVEALTLSTSMSEAPTKAVRAISISKPRKRPNRNPEPHEPLPSPWGLAQNIVQTRAPPRPSAHSFRKSLIQGTHFQDHLWNRFAGDGVPNRQDYIHSSRAVRAEHLGLTGLLFFQNLYDCSFQK